MKNNWFKSKKYMDGMKMTWSTLLFNKEYKELNCCGKKLVKKAIEGDISHNKKDARKIKKENKQLYERGKK